METRGYRVCIRQIRGTRELFHEAVLFQIVCDAGDDFGGRFRPNTGAARNANSTSEPGGNTCCRETADSGAVDYGSDGYERPCLCDYRSGGYEPPCLCDHGSGRDAPPCFWEYRWAD